MLKVIGWIFVTGLTAAVLFMLTVTPDPRNYAIVLVEQGEFQNIYGHRWYTQEGCIRRVTRANPTPQMALYNQKYECWHKNRIVEHGKKLVE